MLGRVFTRASRLLADNVLFGFHPLAIPVQKAVQRLMRGPREVTFRFKDGPGAGLRFSCLSSHKYFFLREDYERDLLEPIARLIRPGSVAFDVGAHFGFWALILSRLCGDAGKVFAFEPSPQNRARLQGNLAINSIENVEIVPFALSDTIGTGNMSDAGSMGSLSGDGIKIETTTVDEFCRHHPKPDFMLIDVEGFATQVLRGAIDLYGQEFVPVICELHTDDEQAGFRRFMDGRAHQVRELDKKNLLPNRTLAI